MPWYNNQSFVSICFQRQKRWRKSEFNLFSKAKALAPSQNEGNSGSGTLETAVLFGLRMEWDDFFNARSHPILCFDSEIQVLFCTFGQFCIFKHDPRCEECHLQGCGWPKSYPIQQS